MSTLPQNLTNGNTPSDLYEKAHNYSAIQLNPDVQRPPNMLAWALRYAERGISVFPLHTPLHNHPEGWRCSCEDYRHTELCQGRDAERKRRGRPPLYLADGEHCVQPGKHPRGVQSWRAESTTDAATIRKWWGRHPDANIGIDTGKTGLLVLDADAYKENFAGASLLSKTDEKTPTVLTGGGGQHLYYRMPEGKAWGNQTGALPPGIDIRGHGGFVVAAPSLHASGRRYAFELDYSLGDLPLADVPAWLAGILDGAAKRNGYTTGAPSHRWDGCATVAPVDLAGFNLSGAILDQIAHAAPRGERSETDMRICVSLLYAGASDDDIRAIFEHNPIGTAGKVAERGLPYLAHTLDAARRWVTAHPKPVTPQDARKTIDAVRLALRELDFAVLVPADLQAVNGYRTGETDKIVADAALAHLADYGVLESRISNLQLSERTGRSTNTCRAAMNRLAWLLEPVATPGSGEAASYRLAVAYIDRYQKETIVGTCQSTQLPISSHGGHDAFVRSMTPITQNELDARNAQRAADGLAPMRLAGDLRRRLAAIIPSAGPAVLLAIDALEIHGGAMTRAALGAKLFKKKSAISRLVRRGLFLGFLSEDGDAIRLAAGWRDASDALASSMPTAGTAHRRKIAAADSRQRYCEAALRNGNLAPDERKGLHRRAERAATAKLTIARQEAADLAQRKFTIRAVGMASKPVRLDDNRGLHTPNRATAGASLADAAFWHRVGNLTPSQKAYVEMASCE